MKTSLAYINDRVDRMVDAECESPTISPRFHAAAKKPTVIAGFDVIDKRKSEAILQQGRDERRLQVVAYLQCKAEIASTLKLIDVTPLAIVPTKTFHEICKQSGLYYPPADMMVSVNLEGFEKFRKENFSHRYSAATDSGSWTGRWRKAPAEPHYDNPVEAYIASKSHGDLMRELISTGQAGGAFDTSRMTSADFAAYMHARARANVGVGNRYLSDLQSHYRARITLPQPPEDVIEILSKVSSLNPKTVAVYDAIAFADGAPAVINQAMRAKIEAERKEREYRDWLKHDPIVYIEHDKATAVVAQFGEFPIEQKIVDLISAAEFLPD